MEAIQRVRYLSAQFQGRIAPFEVLALRKAIAASGGDMTSLFHNHLPDDQYDYDYPLVQYKRIGGHAAMVCIGAGVEAAQKLLDSQLLEVTLRKRSVDLRIKNLRLKAYPMRIWNKGFLYQISAWLPFAEKGYPEWQQAPDLRTRLEILEGKLCSHIVLLTKGLDWEPNEMVQVEITRIDATWHAYYKGLPFKAFDLRFMSNVFLPDFLGLGKAAAMGFGVLKQIYKRVG